MVTGGGGFVAGCVVRLAPEDLELHAFTKGEPLLQRPWITWHSLDLCDTSRLDQAFGEVHPGVLIHAAAMADIDFCEAHQDVAERVNVGVTQDLVRLCSQHQTRMITMSTDTVFDGERAPYKEEDRPEPVNFYGRTKVKGESIVLNGLKNALVVRTSLVMGLPMLDAGNSFLSRNLSSLEQGKTLEITDQEIRTPVDVITLARVLLETAGNDLTGILHVAGDDRLSRYEMTRRILEHFGYPADRVVAKDAATVPGRARRPRDVSLDNRKARSALTTPMRGLEQGLDLIMEMKKGFPS